MYNKQTYITQPNYSIQLKNTEEHFKSVCLLYGQSLEYCNSFLNSLQDNASISTQSQLQLKNASINQEIQLLTNGQSISQKITKLLAERDKVIHKLKCQLFKNKMSKFKLLISCCDKIDKIRWYNLIAVQHLEEISRKWKIQSSEYFRHVMQKINIEINFLSYSQLTNWIPLSTEKDPFFLIPFKKIQAQPLQSNLLNLPIQGLFNISLQYKQRFQNADKFAKKINQQKFNIKSYPEYHQKKQKSEGIFLNKNIIFPQIKSRKNHLLFHTKDNSNKKMEYSLNDILQNFTSKEHNKRYVSIENNIMRKRSKKSSNQAAISYDRTKDYSSNTYINQKFKNSHVSNQKPQNSALSQHIIAKQKEKPSSKLIQKIQPQKLISYQVKQGKQKMIKPQNYQRSYMMVGGKIIKVIRNQGQQFNTLNLQSVKKTQISYKSQDSVNKNHNTIKLYKDKEKSQTIQDFVFVPFDKKTQFDSRKIRDEDQIKNQSPIIFNQELVLETEGRQIKDDISQSIYLSPQAPLQSKKRTKLSVIQKKMPYSLMTNLKNKDEYFYNQPQQPPMSTIISQEDKSVHYEPPFEKISQLSQMQDYNWNNEVKQKDIHDFNEQVIQYQSRLMEQNNGEVQDDSVSQADTIKNSITKHQQVGMNTKIYQQQSHNNQQQSNINHQISDPNAHQNINQQDGIQQFSPQKVLQQPLFNNLNTQIYDHQLEVNRFISQLHQKQVNQLNFDKSIMEKKTLQNQSQLVFKPQKKYHKQSLPLLPITPQSKFVQKNISDKKKINKTRPQKIPIPQDLKVDNKQSPQKYESQNNDLKHIMNQLNTKKMKNQESKYNEIMFQQIKKSQQYQQNSINRINSSESILREQSIILNDSPHKYIHRPNKANSSLKQMKNTSLAKQFQKQETNMLQKCVFQSKSVQNTALLNLMKTISPKSYQDLELYISSNYFKNRHLIITYCLFKNQIVSYCIISPYMMNQMRLIFLLHLEVTDNQFKTLEGSLINMFLNYIFSHDPAQKVLFLRHKSLFNEANKAQLQSFRMYAGQTNTLLKSKVLAQKSCLFERKETKCSKKQQYTSIFNTYMIFVYSSQEKILKVATLQDVYFSSSYLKKIQQNYRGKKAKSFSNGQSLRKYLQKEQLPTFSKTQINGKIVSDIQIVEDCFMNIRFFVHSKHFFFTIQPPFTYLYENQTVFYLLIATSNSKYYFLLSDKIFEEAQQIDLYLNFKQYVDGKNLNDLFLSKSSKNKIIGCPQFKKRVEFEFSQSTKGLAVFELNWKQYIKGVRYLKEENVYLELIGPFFCAYIEIDDQNIIHHCYSMIIQEQNIVR